MKFLKKALSTKFVKLTETAIEDRFKQFSSRL